MEKKTAYNHRTICVPRISSEMRVALISVLIGERNDNSIHHIGFTRSLHLRLFPPGQSLMCSNTFVCQSKTFEMLTFSNLINFNKLRIYALKIGVFPCITTLFLSIYKLRYYTYMIVIITEIHSRWSNKTYRTINHFGTKIPHDAQQNISVCLVKLISL